MDAVTWCTFPVVAAGCHVCCWHVITSRKEDTTVATLVWATAVSAGFRPQAHHSPLTFETGQQRVNRLINHDYYYWLKVKIRSWRVFPSFSSNVWSYKPKLFLYKFCINIHRHCKINIFSIRLYYGALICKRYIHIAGGLIWAQITTLYFPIIIYKWVKMWVEQLDILLFGYNMSNKNPHFVQ